MFIYESSEYLSAHGALVEWNYTNVLLFKESFGER